MHQDYYRLDVHVSRAAILYGLRGRARTRAGDPRARGRDVTNASSAVEVLERRGTSGEVSEELHRVVGRHIPDRVDNVRPIASARPRSHQ